MVVKLENILSVNKDGNVVGGGTIASMHYLQEFKYNFISIPQLLRTGWKMVGDDTKIHTLKFDRAIPTKMGWLYGVVLRIFGDEKANEMAAMAKDTAPMAIYDVHAKFGHMNEKAYREIARHHGVAILAGSLIDIKSFRAPKVKHLLDKVGAYFVTQTGVFK